MMKMFIAMFAAIAVLGGASVAGALDVTQIPSRNLHVTWLEPTLNNDGSPLTDLAKVVVQITIDGVAWVEDEVAVSGPTGGQAGSYTFLDVCAPDAMPNVEVAVYAVDLVGNRSAGTLALLSVDCVAPAPVQ